MLQIEGASYGMVKAVRAEFLEHETMYGWRLIAVVPDTTLVEFQVEEKDQHGYDRWNRKKEHQAVSWFVLAQAEESVIAKLRGDLGTKEAELREAWTKQRELGAELKKEREAAEKAQKEHDQATDLLTRRCETAERSRDHYKTQLDREKKEREDLFKTLRSLLGDEDVNDAVLAAITVSESPTAKQMIVDLMRLREKLDIKTKETP